MQDTIRDQAITRDNLGRVDKSVVPLNGDIQITPLVCLQHHPILQGRAVSEEIRNDVVVEYGA